MCPYRASILGNSFINILCRTQYHVCCILPDTMESHRKKYIIHLTIFRKTTHIIRKHSESSHLHKSPSRKCQTNQMWFKLFWQKQVSARSFTKTYLLQQVYLFCLHINITHINSNVNKTGVARLNKLLRQTSSL